MKYNWANKTSNPAKRKARIITTWAGYGLVWLGGAATIGLIGWSFWTYPVMTALISEAVVGCMFFEWVFGDDPAPTAEELTAAGYVRDEEGGWVLHHTCILCRDRHPRNQDCQCIQPTAETLV